MKRIILIILIFFVALGAAFFYLVGTTRGSAWLVDFILSKLATDYELSQDGWTGSLAQGLSLKHAEFNLSQLGDFPQGYILRLENFSFHINGWGLKEVDITMQNARLIMPLADPVVLFGSLKDGMLDLNLFAHSLSLEQIRELIPDPDPQMQAYSGTIKDIDLYLKGPLDSLVLTGGLGVEELHNADFRVRDCAVRLDLYCERVFAAIRWAGEIAFDGGRVAGVKTAQVDLETGRLIFERMSPENPGLDFKGQAKVEKTKIQVVLQGTLKEPELVLTSQPPMPQPRLLIMLATNRSWSGVETTLVDRRISADLAKDFLDYFVFSGSGSQMAEQFGIRDFFIEYNDEVQGFGIKKRLTDSLDAIYEVEEDRHQPEGSVNRRHQVGGEYHLRDNLSITAKKGFQQNAGQVIQDATTSQKPAESEIKVEFETKF